MDDQNLPAIADQGGLVAVEMTKAIQEVQAKVISAKRFPRDMVRARARIMEECKSLTLAEDAEWKFPRGGEVLSGPSIRIAEVVVRNYGNMTFGVRELERRNGSSLAQAFCWDLEMNVSSEKDFEVPHEMKAYGKIKKLTDPRDIYELVANPLLVVEPTVPKKAQGWAPLEPLPAQNENWLLKSISQWLAYLEDVTDELIATLVVRPLAGVYPLTLTSADSGKTIVIDSDAARSIILPAPTNGLYFVFVDGFMDGKAGLDQFPATLGRNNVANKIQGLQADYELAAQGGIWRFKADGTGWILY